MVTKTAGWTLLQEYKSIDLLEDYYRSGCLSLMPEAGLVSSISRQWFVVGMYHPEISEFAMTSFHQLLYISRRRYHGLRWLMLVDAIGFFDEKNICSDP